MNLTIITEPEFEPVTLAEVYGHLRLTPSGSPEEHPDDDMLTRNIVTARKDVERITGRALVRQKVRLSMSDFCSMFLLKPPLISVESVQYYDGSNTLASLSASQWYTTDDLVPQIVLVDGVWPTLYNRRDAARVTYWVGYPPDGSPAESDRASLTANVPTEAKDAILLGVQLMYDALTPPERSDIERARDSLLAGLKIHTLA